MATREEIKISDYVWVRSKSIGRNIEDVPSSFKRPTRVTGILVEKDGTVIYVILGDYFLREDLVPAYPKPPYKKVLLEDNLFEI